MLRRLIILGAVFGAALLLLTIKNKVWVGQQELQAELRQSQTTATVFEVVLKDVAGVPQAARDKDDADRLAAEIDRRLKGDDRQAAIPFEKVAVSADHRVQITVSAETAAKSDDLKSRIQGRPVKRDNPPRSLFHLTQGIDISGGVEFICRLHNQEGDNVPATEEVIHILRSRLDQRGLTEPVVAKLSNGDVQVVIPGGTKADAARTRKVLETAGQLEFREVLYPYADKRSYMINAELGKEGSPIVDKGNGRYVLAPGVTDIYLGRGEIIAPHETEIGKAPNQFFRLGKPELTGSDVADAAETLHNGSLAVSITFTTIGAGKNEQFTQRLHKTGPQHGNSQGTGVLAILYDGVVKSAPYVENPSIKECQISGRFTKEEVDSLKTTLRGGALSVTPEVLSERVVGATLGEQTVSKAIYAMVASALLVILFMFMYYRGLGLVANLCLLVSAILITATLSVFDATLTLPGLAGLVLTIGMAVDTNILIFERIREELRGDKGMKAAIAAGYDRAFVTILDSNLTTILTAFILYVIGTGPVQGFGLTLMIGVSISMFSGIFVGRMITDWLYRGKETAAMASWIPELHLPYVEWRVFGYVFSIVTAVLALGWFSLGHLFTGGTFDRHFDIEFTGGNMAQVIFKRPVASSEVEQAVQAAWNNLSPEQRKDSVLDPAELRKQPYHPEFGGGSSSRQWMFRGRDEEGSKLETERAAIEEKRTVLVRKIKVLRDVGKNEKVDQAQVNKLEAELKPLDEQRNRLTDEIASRTEAFKASLSQAFGDWLDREGDEIAAATWKDNRLSVVLRTLETPNQTQLAEIQARLAKYGQITVTAPPPEIPHGLQVTAAYADRPAGKTSADDPVSKRFATLLIPKDAKPDDAANMQALLPVAVDLFNRVAETGAALKVTVAKPFPSTEHFSGQVAARMKVLALVAVLLALVGILAYIAARFEFRFGIGAVVALFHDVLLALGIAVALGVKIDLNVIAALLTIIGFSINDTIVTFDRIRENMKKMPGEPMEKIIDLAVAQTFPRTVLTTGTVLITAIILLIFSGEALYSFNLVLVIGIISGTYSSVFVASPLILAFKGRVIAPKPEPEGPEAGILAKKD